MIPLQYWNWPAVAALTIASAAEPPPREWLEDTGHRVVRLSPDSGGNKLYFHQNAFTATGDVMILASGGGIWAVNLTHLAAVTTQPVIQERTGNVVLGSKSRTIYWLSGEEVRATKLDDRSTRRIGTLPPAMRRCSGFAVNADETLLAGSYVEPAEMPNGAPLPRAPRRTPGRKPNLDTILDLHLPRRLFTINIADGAVRTFHPSTDWLNHVQFSPTDPSQLMFCHEGPWHKVDRVWMIRADGTGLRKIHERTMEMEIAGHEFFSADGRTVWFDLQTPKGSSFWLAGVHHLTGEAEKFALEKREWSVHYNVSPDGKLFAGDGGGPGSVARGDNGQWIYLFRPQNGRLQSEPLVNLQKHNYDLEPNVNFTPDGRWIVFQSNLHGASHVYAVEVKKSEEEKKK